MTNRVLRALCEGYKGNATANHPNSKPSLLVVILTGVGTDNQQATEHLFRIGEIEAVFANGRAVLRLVPLKNHCNSRCSYKQAAFIRAALGSVAADYNDATGQGKMSPPKTSLLPTGILARFKMGSNCGPCQPNSNSSTPPSNARCRGSLPRD